MFIKDLETNEEYFLDLFDKWWHYPLLGLTWFFPHKAYLNEKQTTAGQVKKTQVNGIAQGLAIFAGFIISDYVRSINTFKIPEQYYWLGPYLTYIFLVITLYVCWKYLLNYSSKKVERKINYNIYYHVRIKFYSLDAIIHCYWKLILSFIFAAAMSESIKYDFIGFITIFLISSVVSILISLSAGANVIIDSKEGKKFKTIINEINI